MSDTTAPNMRMLRILEVIAAADKALTPTEVNTILGWPKQSVHRLCNTLIDEGYLEKRGRRLFPRQRLLSLFARLADHGLPLTARHQILQRISAEVGETVNFVRPDTKGMTYVDRVETNWPFRIQLPIGTHVPFHCTASGKVYLSSLKSAERQRMLASLNLSRFTAHTHTSIETLEAELMQINRDGFALDREEFHENMVAVAVPVNDAEGRFLAVLAVHGPMPRFTLDDAESRIGLLQDAARQISKALDA
ncbi:MAG: IclR family transcriptional regulator [Candidatus Puniceispirillales bacterium]